MTLQMIADPKGTFGRPAASTGNRQNRRVATYRNVSTVAIPVGVVVHASTLTTDGTGAVFSTAIAHPLTLGVSLTSASTGSTVSGTSLAPAGSWFQVVVEGPADCHLTTATSPGELVHGGNSTAFGVSTGGIAAPTANLTTGGHATLGWCVKASSDTNTTGSLGIVNVSISRFHVSSTA